MDDIEFKEQIQKQAFRAWKKAGKIGTVELSTGFGKTFVAIKALLSMPPNDNKTHLFLAEVKDRHKDLIDNIKKFQMIYGIHVLKNYNIAFLPYQSAHKLRNKNFGLVIADEIHDGLTPIYSNFFAYNNYDALIGLSAKVKRDIMYEIDGFSVSKGDLLDEYAPVCFKYSLKNAIKDKTSRELNIHVIYNELEDNIKTITAGNKKQKFKQTEKQAYEYWHRRHLRSFYIENEEQRQREINLTANKRKMLLYEAYRKTYITNMLLSYLNSKSIIFANSLKFLEKITQNVVSSKKSDDENLRIRENLEKGKIKYIGSFKKLKQGANLAHDLDNCIIASYYSSPIDLEQRIGRLRSNGKEGNVFIILTKHTQEEVWFNNMITALGNKKIIYHDNVHDCINYLKNKN